jgi:hypothetical protein
MHTITGAGGNVRSTRWRNSAVVFESSHKTEASAVLMAAPLQLHKHQLITHLSICTATSNGQCLKHATQAPA